MRKERKIINTNIRLNLCDEQDRQAWEYLQTMDRQKLEEKNNGSDSISVGENRGNVYGCYFYVFHQKKRMVWKKRSRNSEKL